MPRPDSKEEGPQSSTPRPKDGGGKGAGAPQVRPPPFV